MDGKKQFTNIDPETEADLRLKGFDPQELDEATECTLSHIYANLPKFPVYYGPPVLPDFDGPPDRPDFDGVDHISRLTCELRREIVARLPVKDGARTAVLSTLWREIWLSTPLVLIDAHLLPESQGFRPTLADTPAITAAVSSILEAHPGPFSCVHLICSNMKSYRPQLARWIELLAAKGVQDLVLVNRPWPHDVPLPANIFSITTLTRLYFGKWKLPNMAVLHGVSFPHLRELGICDVFMMHGDLDSLICRCPVLEILNILGGIQGLRLRLISRSLRCVQICLSMMVDIAVVKAPRLERLILYGSCKPARGFCTRVTIGDAPKLHAFGYLEPGQLLDIGNTIITPGINVSTRSMLSSVKVLSVNVRFGVRDDVKMVPAFLRCFPNVERLHIMSEKCDKATGYLKLKFWEKSGPIENVVSHIKMMSLRQFRGEQSGVGFLEFFFRNARVLKLATIVLAKKSSFTPFSNDELASKVVKSTKCMASKNCSIRVLVSTAPEDGEVWSLQTGADLSFRDPFSVAGVM